MLTFTEADVLAWVSPLLWPFLRVLALFGALPVLSQRAVPVRLRIALAALIVLCAQVGLPSMPLVALDNSIAFLLVVQQLLIGFSLGFAVRIVFAAVEFAGEIVGLQMGLNFAGFFDHSTGSQATAVSRFFGVTVSWLFMVANGHLLVVMAVVRSFHAFPVSSEPFAFLTVTRPQTWASEIFQQGLWIALPMIAMLLFTNLVLGVISRVAPQMNIYAIGFPVTVSIGLIGLLLTLPMMEIPFTITLERMLMYFQ